MSYADLIEEQKIETREIIGEMLADGLDPDAEYEIEHHFAADTLAQCEAFYLDASEQGHEVSPPEEYDLDPEFGEGKIYCFDIFVISDLDAENIDEQAEAMFSLAEKHQCDYDGWGVNVDEDESDSEVETER